MRNIILLSWMTFKDSIRNKALYGIFFLGVLGFVANIIVTGMFSWELGKVAVDVGLSVISLSGLVIIFFFSIQMVSNDLERKTIYLILSKPISKPQYILGKFLGLATIVLISSAVLGVCAFFSVKLSVLNVEAYIPVLFNWPTFFLGIVYQTVGLLIVLSIAFLCISVTTHPFTAMILCMTSYFIGENVERVINIMVRNKTFIDNPALYKAAKTISWVFPNLAAFDLKTTAAYGLPLNATYLFWTGIYGITYASLCLIGTIIIFQRRELG